MEADRLRDIIARAQSNQAEGYEQLLAAYGVRLYGYFHRATGDHHESEDLLSELMLRLVRMIKEYDDRGRFEPWLFRIASNMVRDRIRRRTASPSPSGWLGESDGGLADDEMEGPATAVDAGLVATDTSLQLKQALDRLDPTVRDMILLRHFGEMSFREIARLYGCPMGTVMARVHRGFKALRKLLGDDYGK
jgi:RNA polymerase sigma-70 factor (ECF subfamily)